MSPLSAVGLIAMLLSFPLFIWGLFKYTVWFFKGRKANGQVLAQRLMVGALVSFVLGTIAVAVSSTGLSQANQPPQRATTASTSAIASTTAQASIKTTPRAVKIIKHWLTLEVQPEQASVKFLRTDGSLVSKGNGSGQYNLPSGKYKLIVSADAQNFKPQSTWVTLNGDAEQVIKLERKPRPEPVRPPAPRAKPQPKAPECCDPSIGNTGSNTNGASLRSTFPSYTEALTIVQSVVLVAKLTEIECGGNAIPGFTRTICLESAEDFDSFSKRWDTSLEVGAGLVGANLRPLFDWKANDLVLARAYALGSNAIVVSYREGTVIVGVKHQP